MVAAKLNTPFLLEVVRSSAVVTKRSRRPKTSACALAVNSVAEIDPQKPLPAVQCACDLLVAVLSIVYLYVCFQILARIYHLAFGYHRIKNEIEESFSVQ